MTSPRPRPGRVAAAALTAAAALAASALGVAIAAPAYAEEAPYDFQAGAFAEADSWYTGGAHAGEPQAGQFYANPLLEGDETVASFRATLSVMPGSGIILATEDENCVSEGNALICDYVDTNWGAEVGFTLVTDGSIAIGEDVEYTISITADGYDTEYLSDVWNFTSEDEGGWGAEYDVEVTSYTEVEPGTVLDPEFAFANNESDAYEGMYFMAYADEDFLSIAAEYGNCGVNEWGGVLCHLPDFNPEPGVTYEIDPSTPITVTVSEDAPGPIEYHAQFNAVSDAYGEGIEFFDADEDLAFVESEREVTEDWSVMSIETTEHLYDLAVEDRAVDGESLTIPVENLGPAAAFARRHPGSGEGDFMVSIQLPTGVTIGETDEGVIYGDGYFCAAAEGNDWMSEFDPAVYGVERLDVQCWFYDDLAAGATLSINLPVVVADGAKADDGLVVANLDSTGWDFSEFEENWGLSEADYPVLDADLENNTAKLSVGTGGSGQLPVTGSALTITVSAAAAALVAGAVLFVLRRRKAAANW